MAACLQNALVSDTHAVSCVYMHVQALCSAATNIVFKVGITLSLSEKELSNFKVAIS